MSSLMDNECMDATAHFHVTTLGPDTLCGPTHTSAHILTMHKRKHEDKRPHATHYAHSIVVVTRAGESTPVPCQHSRMVETQGYVDWHVAWVAMQHGSESAWLIQCSMMGRAAAAISVYDCFFFANLA